MSARARGTAMSHRSGGMPRKRLLLDIDPPPPPVIHCDDAMDISQDTSQASPSQEITQLNYIRRFMSGKLVFTSDSQPIPFGPSDLEDICPVGDGMFGRVHKMRHSVSGRLLAVKKVRVLSNRNDEQEMNKNLRRLKTEVDAIKAASNCAEVVQFYGITFHEGDCWVCMELMDAPLELVYKTVHQTLKQPHFDEVVLGGTAVAVITALNHLKKDHHIIHRDVKPSNILLNRQGFIKLCDFGISGYLVDSVAQTRDAGCRPYMAPERLLATSKFYNVRSDVWSLGITLVEVATGIFPYPNFIEKPIFAQLEQVVYGDAPLLVSPLYQPMTVNFINSCLIKEVKDRPDFDTLTRKEFYQYYSSYHNMKEHVMRFLEKVLAAAPHHDMEMG